MGIGNNHMLHNSPKAIEYESLKDPAPPRTSKLIAFCSCLVHQLPFAEGQHRKQLHMEHHSIDLGQTKPVRNPTSGDRREYGRAGRKILYRREDRRFSFKSPETVSEVKRNFKRKHRGDTTNPEIQGRKYKEKEKKKKNSDMASR